MVRTLPGAPLAALSAPLADAYPAVRQQSLALIDGLTAEDCAAQSMPDASPAKWHLAHTTWFFETFVLAAWEADFQPFDPTYRRLFNSYYDGVGPRPPRPQRGLLTRPDLARVLAYRAAVDARMAPLLADPPAALAERIRLGLHHEAQHQELMQTDIKHLFSLHPDAPAWGPPPAAARTPGPLRWLTFEGGLTEIGHAGDGFAFDNESPRHRVYLAPYALAHRLVTNAEYLAFIDDGAYADPQYWLAEGRDWLAAGGRTHPLYWRRGDNGWREFTAGGEVPLDPAAPVAHVSYYEADAFARWAEARLPTEAEWEHAAQAAPRVLRQMSDSLWQWTASAYAPYPGFHPAPGALGEYNGKFMVNQQVLRGGSRATPAGHTRPTYRNFFPAAAAWQFSGIRLARDVPATAP